jgi:hypothetical protein
MRSLKFTSRWSAVAPMLALLASVWIPAHAEPLPQKVIAAVTDFDRFLTAMDTCIVGEAPSGLRTSPMVEESIRKVERLVAQGYNADLVRAFIALSATGNPVFTDDTPAAEIIAFCNSSDWHRRMTQFDADLAADIDRVYPLPGGKDDAAVLDLVSGATAPWMTAMLCERLRPPVRESLEKILTLEIPDALAELDRFDLSAVAKDDAKAQINALAKGIPPEAVSTYGLLKGMCDPRQNATLKDYVNAAKKPSELLKELKPAP